MATKLNGQKIGIHIVGCIGFMVLPLIASPRSSVFDTLNFGPPEMRGLLNSALLLVFFYLNFYYFIPRFYHRKQYLQWILIVLCSFAIILVLPRVFITDFNIHPDFQGFHGMMPPPKQPFHDNPFFRSFRLEESLTKFLVVLVLSLLLRTSELWKKSQEEKQKAELSYLKSQVNPHFLFNTLNGIYSLALEESKKTPDAIVKLSELMRYVITDISKDFVPLEDEIQHLINYVELQKLRLGDTVEINLDVTDKAEHLFIAPLLLIPFVENAFKYGINPKFISQIDIKLHVVEDKMEFQVKNKIEPFSALMVQNGTGLENVKKRLELTYPGAFDLSIQDNHTDFIVKLILNLKL